MLVFQYTNNFGFPASCIGLPTGTFDHSVTFHPRCSSWERWRSVVGIKIVDSNMSRAILGGKTALKASILVVQGVWLSFIISWHTGNAIAHHHQPRLHLFRNSKQPHRDCSQPLFYVLCVTSRYQGTNYPTGGLNYIFNHDMERYLFLRLVRQVKEFGRRSFLGCSVLHYCKGTLLPALLPRIDTFSFLL